MRLPIKRTFNDFCFFSFFFALTKKLKWATVGASQIGHVSTSLDWPREIEDGRQEILPYHPMP